ncbi:radical SAM protein [Kitasatospora sp. RB6PN24]|uniref:radical SAM/SPASM domain-containing protein n=1 Tax=Kitasatospora humi TaxID=2893891 RepID=UPI001E607D84|nr:radical SAM protein [Kitasatospora humi]MCC9312335.1 radical SAM protein [Kitasatospora humi]
MTATVIDDLPAFVTDDWTYLLMPRSMHALRVPTARRAEAPWRPVLDRHRLLATGRFHQTQPPAWGVSLVVSHLCNMSCVYCFSEVGHSQATLPLQRMLAMVDHALERKPATLNQPFSVNFFGGEPTLNMPEVKAVVEYVKKRCAEEGVSYLLRMVTNGTAPREDMQYVVDNGFQLTVSMDAAPARQQSQRIYGTRHNVSDTIETIRFLAANSAEFRVRSTITGETVEYMDETVRFFADLGVRFLHFEPVGPSGTTTAGRLRRYSSPSPEIYATNLIKAMDAARGTGLAVFGYAFQHLLTDPLSYCGPMNGEGNYFVLNATGDLIMCPELQDPKRNKEYNHNVGKVGNDRKVFVDLKRRSEIGAEAMPLQNVSCQSCYARDICKSGCPSRNIQATGSLTKLDPYSCSIAKVVCADILGRLARATFDGVEASDEAVLRPIVLPSELCSPPFIGAGATVLKKAKLLLALSGEDIDNAVDQQLHRLSTHLVGIPG